MEISKSNLKAPQALNGFFNINKPVNMSSAKAVAIIKKKFNLKKVGHMGTLDPLADGVLIIAVGKATKLFNFLLNKTKTYKTVFEFGYETDTFDLNGQIVNSGGRIPALNEVGEKLKNFKGKIMQTPPKFSACHVAGKRAYDLARKGKEFELQPKAVEIFKFNLLKQLTNEQFLFEIECSSGTYIRALCRDLSLTLSTYGITRCITRTKCGMFNIEDAKLIEEILVTDVIDIEKVKECV